MSQTLPYDIRSIDPSESVDEATVVAFVDLWNRAFDADMAISPAFVRYNLRASAGVSRCLFVAASGTQIAGVALATALHGAPKVNVHGEGWIDAIVVAPPLQRRGLGRLLLDLAEEWLARQGSRSIQIGAGLRPFVPGAPDASRVTDFFERQGYVRYDTAWDMAADLATYTPPPTMREAPCAARPATPQTADDLLSFLRREFPGRWLYEAEMFLADGGRLSDFMLLWTERGVDGCCLLTFPDSVRPMERFYPYRLPKPWGQLGSIGISADRRQQGFGAALLDAGLRRLHNNGVNGCVIDWTNLVNFYGKFGFECYRAYSMLGKTIKS